MHQIPQKAARRNEELPFPTKPERIMQKAIRGCTFEETTALQKQMDTRRRHSLSISSDLWGTRPVLPQPGYLYPNQALGFGLDPSC